MIPNAMDNYFLASAGAGAALVGLIFVAISLWPREKLIEAPPAWRAVAGGSFFALINAFFISLSALNTGLNLGWPVLAMCLIGLVNSLFLGFPLLRSTSHREEHIRIIERDKAAVLAGLTLPHSNGLVEGKVNKLKLIKRMIYGKAGFALLRQRVLHRIYKPDCELDASRFVFPRQPEPTPALAWSLLNTSSSDT